MNRARRLADILLVIVIVSVVAVISHFYIAAPRKLHRFIYPAEALAARLTVQCSEDAPAWLAEALKRSTVYSLAGQITHIAGNGTESHCLMGWEGKTLLSDRVSADSYFRLASLTKVVTSLAYLKLEREEKIRPTSRILNFFTFERQLTDPRIADVNIDHLLRHTAGFDRLATPDPMFIRNRRSWCPSQIDQLYQVKLDFTPGEKAVYGNLDYCLLGEIIGAVHGSDYKTAVRELLGLDEYDLAFMDGPYHPREVEYDFRNEHFYDHDYYKFFNFEDATSAIGLIGTTQALSRLVFDNRELLQPLFMDDLEAEGCQLDTLLSCFRYSMTPLRKKPNETLVFVHAGFIWGASSFIMVDEHGGVTTWAGKGSPKAGTEQTQEFQWTLYELLNRHYLGTNH